MKPNGPDSRTLPVVAVVGGGASGVLVALRLAGTAAAKAGRFRLWLFERGTALGRGVAYGTAAPYHLLNVRQERMSAFAEDPDHFREWVARAHPADAGRDFQPRSRYAEYLRAALGAATTDLPPGTFGHVRAEATGFVRRPDGTIEVRLENGDPFVVDRLVLATGYRAPEVPAVLRAVRESARFVADPWSATRDDAIGAGERLLVLGSGLTTVDFVLGRLRGGRSTPIDAVSRRGLRPLAHPDRAPAEVRLPAFDETSPRAVLRALREAAAKSEWTAVVDRFRIEVARIWEAWPERTKTRFLRHARVYWEIHRHRVAPDAHREWESAVAAGRVRLEAGRVVEVSEERGGLRVRIEKRGGGSVEERYDRIVNCTGAAPDLSLLEGHDYANDPLRLGALTDALGRPIRVDGAPDPAIFVFGPALRTRYWEMTAVPDLRTHAKILADALVSSMKV